MRINKKDLVSFNLENEKLRGDLTLLVCKSVLRLIIFLFRFVFTLYSIARKEASSESDYDTGKKASL